MPLTNGSGLVSGSGCGSGSFYFHRHSRCQQKTDLNIFFLHITFWRYFYINFQRWKVKKKSQNSTNQGSSSYFCSMVEGSRSRSTPLANGSGSGSRRPKNTWIRWIRIRIRNTAFSQFLRNSMVKTGADLICIFPPSSPPQWVCSCSCAQRDGCGAVVASPGQHWQFLPRSSGNRLFSLGAVIRPRKRPPTSSLG